MPVHPSQVTGSARGTARPGPAHPAGDTHGDLDTASRTRPWAGLGPARSGARQVGVSRVGITGHSDLTAPSLGLVRAALHQVLVSQAPPWVGVSCLARGSDQLFAALVLALGGQLQVILPAGDYRARKVAPDNAAEFDRLLGAATAVTVMDYPACSREAYMAASQEMLSTVDRVLAVWDGHPARRRGSTGDVVAVARRQGLPTTILWPAGAIRLPPPVAGRPIAHPGLLQVLAGLVFPAQRWQVVIHAEYYGADLHTRTLLDVLPDGSYANLAAVSAALTTAVRGSAIRRGGDPPGGQTSTAGAPT